MQGLDRREIVGPDPERSPLSKKSKGESRVGDRVWNAQGLERRWWGRGKQDIASSGSYSLKISNNSIESELKVTKEKGQLDGNFYGTKL